MPLETDAFAAPNARVCVWLLMALCGSAVLRAEEPWTAALARMPLATPATELSWSNAIPLLLPALQSNVVVKGLVFLPGATDEFYLFRRATVRLTNASSSLLDAVRALTNQTRLQATFRAPLLLLHTPQDRLDPALGVQHPPTAEKLRQTPGKPRLLCVDRDWDFLEPLLRKSLKVDIRPWRDEKGSWHFYRVNLASWNLDGLETLRALALASHTKVTIRRKQVLFELDEPGPDAAATR